MVPIISFIGYSGSGKTSFLEKIIPRLKNNGLRVAVIKHAAHGFELDQPGKDSWRFCKAGSDITVLISPGKTAAIEVTSGEPDLGAIISSIQEKVDIILVEGYKKAKLPKIEIRATFNSPGLPCPEEDLIAIVIGEAIQGDLPHFSPEDIELVVKKLTEISTPSLSLKGI